MGMGEMKNYSRSDFLYARPRDIFGVARFLDLGSSFDLYNESPSEAVADARAIWTDWASVGDYIEQASELTSNDENDDIAA
jgi:hypothetical protein